MTPRASGAASPFFLGHLDVLREASQLGPIVDLASGRGRHAIASARAGLPTIAIDRNPDLLRELAASASAAALPLAAVRCDLETGLGPPLAPARCGAVLVFRYLHRPLTPTISRLLAPGGLLVYETFTTGQRARGTGPRSPEFLLEPGELPSLFPDLEVLEHDEVPKEDEVTARLLARRPR
jgi:tellurite methyltransferase